MRRALLVASLLVGVSTQAQGVSLPMENPELTGGVAGRVCEDRDGDGVCSLEEPGVPQARVYLETGQFALTDLEGRYHLSAASAREVSLGNGGRFLFGRHRLALDARSLPEHAQVEPKRVTIELPMGGVWQQDFAVRLQRPDAAPLALAYGEHPPAATSKAGGARFRVTGKAPPGDTVWVNGTAAQLDSTGHYEAWVDVADGRDVVALAVHSPAGQVQFYEQRIDVIRREGSVLVVPRALRPLGTLALPLRANKGVPAGKSFWRFEAVPGTQVNWAGKTVEVGASGAVLLPIELRAGKNDVVFQVTAPGQSAIEERVSVSARWEGFAVGLLDLEAGYSPQTKSFSLLGRGAAHLEQPLGAWNLSGELVLDDQDVTAMKAGSARLLLTPASPEHWQRSLDSYRNISEWGDDSTGVVPNSAGGRLRLEAQHPEFGKVGLGSNRAVLEDAEIGRFQRSTFGPYADLHAPLGAVTVGGKGFYAPGWVDPLRGLLTVPAHDELTATGGSVYYLSHSAIAEGTEEVRVEVRDGVGQLPLAERHLVRGRDYEIDYLSGRILLARPLSFVEADPVLRSLPLSANAEPVLLVDYERLELGGDARAVGGGEARVGLGAAKVSLGAVAERSSQAAYRLYRTRASLPLGPLLFSLEAAKSQGSAVDASGFSLSDDGGLRFFQPKAAQPWSGGEAFGIRLKAPGLLPQGTLDGAFRWRSSGFSDRTHTDFTLFRQLSLRAEQPLGDFVVGLLGDQREGEDPRVPFAGKALSTRTLGMSFGYRVSTWEARIEAKDAQLTAAPNPLVDAAVKGGRTSLGVSARYRLLPSLELLASHQHTLATRGAGLGAVNDGFTSGGIRWHPKPETSLGIRGGYGPVLGPLAWLEGEHRQGADTYYGTYSVDVDGPDVGQVKAVSGARTSIGDGSTVYVEDVAAHDASSLRLARAVGASQQLGGGLRLSARYEHGVRSPLEVRSPLQRDAGGISVSLLRERFRVYGRAELRKDKGISIRSPQVNADLIQRLFSGAAEVDVLSNLRASAHVNFSNSFTQTGLATRFLEGTTGLALRLSRGIAILRYTLLDGVSPQMVALGISPSLPRRLHILSFLPSFHWGQRFTLAAGGNAGWSVVSGGTALVVSASIRPSVRVVSGFEVAAEAVRRSAAPDGGQLNALRGEVGYRVQDGMLFALGYTVLGFSGLGLSAGEPNSRERIYARAELAY